MRVILVGTGTSQGIPIIGCSCKTCLSDNSKDNRLRASAYIEIDNARFLIDTSIDFRQQMLKYNITDLDAVLYTHHHVDHILGLDDIRQINQRLDKYIDIFGNKTTMDEIKITFRYAFDRELIHYKAVPLFNINVIENASFVYRKTEIIPIEVMHGRIKIFGYRIKNFAYITDCSEIPEEEYEKLKNLDVLVINALRRRPHPTHMNIENAIKVTERIRPQKTYFTHITHDINYDEISPTLPENIYLAYDGLEIILNTV